MNDKVNHPSHYTTGKVECIDALESATINLTGIEAVCTANVIKYMWIWKQKNGTEDLEKAKWYLEYLLTQVNNTSKGNNNSYEDTDSLYPANTLSNSDNIKKYVNSLYGKKNSDILNSCYKGKRICIGDYVRITVLNGKIYRGIIESIYTDCITLKTLAGYKNIDRTVILDIQIPIEKE
jgi:hypothetical protein